MRDRLVTLLEKLRSFVVRFIRSRTVFSDGVSARPVSEGLHSVQRPLLGIVLSQHLASRAESFPPIPRRQLKQILSARQAGATSDVERFVVGDIVDGRRWVTFFRLNPDADRSVEKAFFILPEILPLARSMRGDELVVIEREAGRAFLNGNGSLSRAGGLIDSAKQFLLGAGLPEATPIRILDDAAAREAAINSLTKLRWSDWLSVLNPGLRTEGLLMGRPLVIGIAFFLLAYLLTSSIYLVGMTEWRSQQVDVIQAEVTPLLATQRQVDLLHLNRSGLLDLYGKRVETWQIWEVVRVVWLQGGQLRGWAFSSSEVTLRGTAPSATAVLGAVSALKMVAGASFDAPVRSAGEREEFVIKFSLVGPGKVDASR
jgi:hypothetical protein